MREAGSCVRALETESDIHQQGASEAARNCVIRERTPGGYSLTLGFR